MIRYGLGEVIAIPIVEERVCAGSLCLKQLELMLAVKIQGVQEQGAFDGFWALHMEPVRLLFCRVRLDKGSVRCKDSQFLVSWLRGETDSR